VSLHDLVAFAIAPFALLTIAFFASYVPAYRAAQTDPTEALRHG
jgi:ABC-type lipoprotein release transport system permease subunit